MGTRHGKTATVDIPVSVLDPSIASLKTSYYQYYITHKYNSIKRIFYILYLGILTRCYMIQSIGTPLHPIYFSLVDDFFVSYSCYYSVLDYLPIITAADLILRNINNTVFFLLLLFTRKKRIYM